MARSCSLPTADNYRSTIPRWSTYRRQKREKTYQTEPHHLKRGCQALQHAWQRHKQCNGPGDAISPELHRVLTERFISARKRVCEGMPPCGKDSGIPSAKWTLLGYRRTPASWSLHGPTPEYSESGSAAETQRGHRGPSARYDYPPLAH